MSKPSLAVIIPFRGGCRHREASMEYQVEYCTKVFSGNYDFELVVADDPGLRFNRGRALNEGVRRSSADTLIFLDGDLHVGIHEFVEAFRLLAKEECSFVVPFSSVNYLNPEGSRLTLKHRALVGRYEGRWTNRSTGGCNVLYRQDFLPFDNRFSGWGFEDAAWAMAMETLRGPARWVEKPCYHFWHPSAFDSQHPDHAASVELCGRYTAAHKNKTEMEKIIKEIVW